MSNAVKSKFAGLLRGLLRRMDDHPVEIAAPAPRPVAAAAPKAPNLPAGPQISPKPAPVATTSAVDELVLPIAPIVAGLPIELRAKILSVPPAGMSIHVPVETIASQLAFGTVKISFGELRRLAPGLFANSGAEHDQKMVTLPLGEILPRLSPGLLARRAASKVEVDDAINGPFGSRCNGVSFTAKPLKSPAPLKPAAPAEPKAPAPGLPSYTLPPRTNKPANPAPIPFTPPPGLQRPAAKPVNGDIHRAAPPSVPPPAPASPAPMVLKISAAPAPVPPAAATPRIEPAQPTILAGLWDLAENWPEELKNEILATGLANENVPLAGDRVEAGLKRGRVTMSWKQLRTLAKPSSSPSVNDGLELDLPLKVIAPLFFAAKKKLNGSQKRTAVSEDIPNLFFGFPQAAPPSPAGAQIPAEKKSSESTFYVWGDTDDKPQFENPVESDSRVFSPPPVPQTDFMSRQAQPKDIVARAKVLPGVAGVVIALPDGLRVASEVPAEFNADTLAAFVPQIYERMNQSAKELRMGPLDNVSFTVGDVPWKIFRVNAVYVAAFGRAGESLPSAELAALAGELNRKKAQ
jgi:predicted regulator of Ras-like GTPase activity (Roadblock/LC7/MglB family)